VGVAILGDVDVANLTVFAESSFEFIAGGTVCEVIHLQTVHVGDVRWTSAFVSTHGGFKKKVGLRLLPA